MSFTHWLRENSEHYLMIDAQRRIAQKYGRPAPPKPRSLVERFWLDVFAPVYRLLPWKVRSKTIQLMPGSHRQQWSRPAERRVPAVGPTGPDPQQVQETQLLPPAQSQTGPENRGE